MTQAALSPIDALQRLLQRDASPLPTQRDLARPLAQALLAAMPSTTPKTLLQFGSDAIAALWPENEADAPARMRALEKRIGQIKDTNTKKRYAELLAKLGHIHQLAGLLLRERELSYTTTPKTMEAFLSGKLGKGSGHHYGDAKEAVEALNAPRIDLTFTAHPTNTNSLSNMEAQRALGKAVSALRTDKSSAEDLAEALKQFANAPLLPEMKANGLHGFTVRQETQNMLYHLNAVYDDMEAVYQAQDNALNNKFGDAYKPETLELGVKFHSWGSSGDKDGNKNVNADSTLYALAMHHQHILLKYREALRELNEPALDIYQRQIVGACTQLTDITKTLEDKLNQSPFLSEPEHEALRGELQAAVGTLDMKGFEQALAASCSVPENQKKEEATLLLRRVRMFGKSFGTIEFRETAEEFTRIMGKLIDGYSEADETARQAMLNGIMSDPGKLDTFREDFRKLAARGEAREYDKTDAAPIAYHTLKRLELARDFPEAIQNHVLAECQDTSNLLELLLLQHAAGKDGVRPTLGIVPLFEDRGPLEKAPDILKTVLRNPHYEAHLEAVAKAQGQKLAQQIQLAHSDNARRNGLPAARALIYQAHNHARAAMDKVNQERGDNPIALQFYEGGSLTDSYRGGTRAISAAINEFGIHDFFKTTAQGADMLNYFNLPHSTYRVMLRNISNNAARLKGTKGVALLSEEKIIKALSACSDDYKVLFEGAGKDELNSFLESIDFAAEASAGNASSRAGARDDNTRVDATKVRTISFSEGCQHAGLNPSWIGSLTLAGHMAKQGLSLSPEKLHALYQSESPIFKDVVDRMLFGLVRTDMEYLREKSGNHPLMARLDEEHSRAFKLCMEAYTGKPLEEITKGETLNAAQEHALLVKLVYEHTQDVFADQDRFTALVRSMKANCAKMDTSKPNVAALRMVLHNGMDTIVHGRLPLIDDPTYATLYCDARNIERPFAPALAKTSSRAA